MFLYIFLVNFYQLRSHSIETSSDPLVNDISLDSTTSSNLINNNKHNNKIKPSFIPVKSNNKSILQISKPTTAITVTNDKNNNISRLKRPAKTFIPFNKSKSVSSAFAIDTDGSIRKPTKAMNVKIQQEVLVASNNFILNYYSAF